MPATNGKNESPAFSALSGSDLQFLNHGGANVPPLIGDKFFQKQQRKSLAQFSSFVRGAASTFPTKDFEKPKTYFLIAAYVLDRNCGKM